MRVPPQRPLSVQVDTDRFRMLQVKVTDGGGNTSVQVDPPGLLDGPTFEMLGIYEPPRRRAGLEVEHEVNERLAREDPRKVVETYASMLKSGAVTELSWTRRSSAGRRRAPNPRPRTTKAGAARAAAGRTRAQAVRTAVPAAGGSRVRARGNVAEATRRRDEVLAWMRRQSEPFELAEIMGRFGCSHGFASCVTRRFLAAGEIERVEGGGKARVVYRRKAAT